MGPKAYVYPPKVCHAPALVLPPHASQKYRMEPRLFTLLTQPVGVWSLWAHKELKLYCFCGFYVNTNASLKYYTGKINVLSISHYRYLDTRNVSGLSLKASVVNVIWFHVISKLFKKKTIATSTILHFYFYFYLFSQSTAYEEKVTWYDIFCKL